eukprot:scaffold138042_cov112-Phaeocystis_antarctica.AAC.1
MSASELRRSASESSELRCASCRCSAKCLEYGFGCIGLSVPLQSHTMVDVARPRQMTANGSRRLSSHSPASLSTWTRGGDGPMGHAMGARAAASIRRV